jgi:hypothetical protein
MLVALWSELTPEERRLLAKRLSAAVRLARFWRLTSSVAYPALFLGEVTVSVGIAWGVTLLLEQAPEPVAFVAFAATLYGIVYLLATHPTTRRIEYSLRAIREESRHRFDVLREVARLLERRRDSI